MSIETGGPAFPVDESALIRNLQGMTLRDYFAARALSGLLSDTNVHCVPAEFARCLYDLADAMLKARAQ